MQSSSVEINSNRPLSTDHMIPELGNRHTEWVRRYSVSNVTEGVLSSCVTTIPVFVSIMTPASVETLATDLQEVAEKARQNDDHG